MKIGTGSTSEMQSEVEILVLSAVSRPHEASKEEQHQAPLIASTFSKRQNRREESSITKTPSSFE